MNKTRILILVGFLAFILVIGILIWKSGIGTTGGDGGGQAPQAVNGRTQIPQGFEAPQYIQQAPQAHVPQGQLSGSTPLEMPEPSQPQQSNLEFQPETFDQLTALQKQYEHRDFISGGQEGGGGYSRLQGP